MRPLEWERMEYPLARSLWGDFQGKQFEEIGKNIRGMYAKRNAFDRTCLSKGENVPLQRENSLENIAYCVRSACELGMDIVKNNLYR